VSHVLAAQAVAARRRLHQSSGLVAKADRQPVELRLRRVFDFIDVLQPLAHAPIECDDVFILEPIVERQHRPRVDDFLQLADGRRADALRRRIGCHQVGILFFERLQLAHQPVVLGVGDLRIVEHVVAIVVMLELRAQLTDSCRGALGCAGGHRVPDRQR
jgi:hypothetical protein